MGTIITEWHEPHPRRVPTADETSEYQRRILELNAQVEETETQIQNLKRLHIRLEQELRNRRSFIAPFRRLPNEILCQIAWHCTSLGVPLSHLNQICAAMRFAVNGYKALWTEIIISGKAHSKPGSCFKIDHLQQIIQRALPLPLTIEFRSPELIPSFMQELIPYSRHVESLKLSQLDPFHASIECKSLPKLNYEGVKDLEIWVRDDMMALIALNLLEQVYNSSLHLNSLSLSFNSPTRNLPRLLKHPIVEETKSLQVKIKSPIHRLPEFAPVSWDQLTFGPFSKLECLNLNKSLDLLPRFLFPNLVTLGAYGSHERLDLCIENIPTGIQTLYLNQVQLVRGERMNVTRCTLPNLLSLSFSDVTLNDPNIHIIAPRMERLLFGGRLYVNLPYIRDQLKSFCADNTLFGSLSLRHVELLHLLVTAETVFALSPQKDLTCLVLHDCVPQERPLDCLIEGDDDEMELLPNLACLGCTFSREDLWSDDPYGLEFQKSCWEKRPSLRVVIE